MFLNRFCFFLLCEKYDLPFCFYMYVTKSHLSFFMHFQILFHAAFFLKRVSMQDQRWICRLNTRTKKQKKLNKTCDKRFHLSQILQETFN